MIFLSGVEDNINIANERESLINFQKYTWIPWALCFHTENGNFPNGHKPTLEENFFPSFPLHLFLPVALLIIFICEHFLFFPSIRMYQLYRIIVEHKVNSSAHSVARRRWIYQSEEAGKSNLNWVEVENTVRSCELSVDTNNCFYLMILLNFIINLPFMRTFRICDSSVICFASSS